MNMNVTRRGGDVPDSGDVTDAGLPITTSESIGKNAWLLWLAARRVAEQEGKPSEKDGVAGWEWRGTLVGLEQDLWKAMTSTRTDPYYIAASTARKMLRRYLRDSGNIVIAGDNYRGGGRYGTPWWVRGEWDATVPALWTDSGDNPSSTRGDLTVSWACPVCRQPMAGSAELNTHRQTEHSVTAPELPGDSLLADILTCMGDDDRIHVADLGLLLAAGNLSAYGSVSVIMLSKTLRDLGVHSRQISISRADGARITRSGLYRADVEAGLAREEDADSKVIVAEVAAGEPDVAGQFAESAAGILAGYNTLQRRVEEQDELIGNLRRQPVSQKLIDDALAKVMAAKDAELAQVKAERDAALRMLKATRKVLGGSG